MKRSLVLTAALSLAAVLISAAPSFAQSPTFYRGAPEEVTAATTPARDLTRPYTFTTTGSIVAPGRYCAPGQTPSNGPGNCVPILCPPGVTDPRYCFVPGPAVICTGVVTVRFKKNGNTISSRNVGVRPDCTYRSQVSFRSRLRTRTGVLSVSARFQGNLVLRPKSSTTSTVQAG